MGILSQPKVSPLPSDIDLRGKTAIVTGASGGLGYETCLQLLANHISTVILAVRTVAKGEACVKQLRQHPIIKSHNPDASIKVVKLDVDSYDSVKAFANQIKSEHPTVHLLILNAGIGGLKFEKASSNHERILQVNYLSNVLLVFELLAVLEMTAEKQGTPSRITWVGSRMHHSTTLVSKNPIRPGEGVIEHFDKEEHFGWAQYNDTKALCAMFMYELAPLLDKSKVEINMLCPGMVNTGMSDKFLPFYLRFVVDGVKAIRGRSIDVGTWVVMNAAVVVGPESHGKFLADKEIETVDAFILSKPGQAVQKKLWNESLAEVGKFTTLPPYVSPKA